MKVRHAHSQETTLISETPGSKKKTTRAWDSAVTKCNLAWHDPKVASEVLLQRTKRDRTSRTISPWASGRKPLAGMGAPVIQVTISAAKA